MDTGGFKLPEEKKWPKYLLMAGLVIMSLYLLVVLVLFFVNYFSSL